MFLVHPQIGFVFSTCFGVPVIVFLKLACAQKGEVETKSLPGRARCEPSDPKVTQNTSRPHRSPLGSFLSGWRPSLLEAIIIETDKTKKTWDEHDSLKRLTWKMNWIPLDAKPFAFLSQFAFTQRWSHLGIRPAWANMGHTTYAGGTRRTLNRQKPDRLLTNLSNRHCDRPARTLRSCSTSSQ